MPDQLVNRWHCCPFFISTKEMHQACIKAGLPDLSGRPPYFQAPGGACFRHQYTNTASGSTLARRADVSHHLHQKVSGTYVSAAGGSSCF
jgi:hypothetical protein